MDDDGKLPRRDAAMDCFFTLGTAAVEKDPCNCHSLHSDCTLKFVIILNFFAQVCVRGYCELLKKRMTPLPSVLLRVCLHCFIEILYYLLSVNGGFQVGPIPGDSRQISKYDSWESHFNRGFLGYGAHYQLPVSTNKALAHNMEKTMKSHGNLQRVQMQCGHFSCFRNQANQLRDTCWELTFFCTGMRLPRPYGFKPANLANRGTRIFPGVSPDFLAKTLDRPVGKYDSFYEFPTKNI